MLAQINSEKASYSLESADIMLPTTKAEVLKMVEATKKTCDILFMSALIGVTDDNGQVMPEKDVMLLISETFGKPVFASMAEHVEWGAALLAVAKTGFEQGSKAAAMLLEAIGGKPVADIPITKNESGKKYINTTLMEKYLPSLRLMGMAGICLNLYLLIRSLGLATFY